DHVAVAERDALAEHAHPVDRAVVADADAARDDAAVERAVAADLGALHHDRTLDRRVPADGDAALEHHPPADLRARADPAAALHQRRGDDAPAVLDALLHAQVAVAHPLLDRGADRALEDVVGALQVAVGGPDV